MAYPTYREMNKDIALCYSNVATDSMLQTVQEIKGDDEEAICDIAVSCDGTWRQRGYSSLNGIVTAVSVETGKPLITTFSQRNVFSALHGRVEGERIYVHA